MEKCRHGEMDRNGEIERERVFRRNYNGKPRSLSRGARHSREGSNQLHKINVQQLAARLLHEVLLLPIALRQGGVSMATPHCKNETKAVPCCFKFYRTSLATHDLWKGSGSHFDKIMSPQ